ncbi:MAG: HAD hydrolase-like protein [Actinomycetota bacterium]|nr:HAD hydrolase-like protein [Actinomycetota bacterium]
MIHVVWDWNGTLVDDLPIVVESVNVALATIGEVPIDEDDYREHFTRPVDQFYVRLLERPISDREWSTLDRVFHEWYGESLDRVPLAADAIDAIDDVEARGWGQSILSMWWEKDLTSCVERRGLSERMTLIQGNRNDAGGEKAAHLLLHLSELDVDAASVVMIGDSLDDAAAAGVVGTACVLYDGGSHHRSHLEDAGVPVTDTLMMAVRVAAQLER